MDLFTNLIMAIANIIQQVLGMILVIYSAIVGTLFGGLVVVVSSTDGFGAGYLTFFCVGMILTVILYMLLIILGVLGSALVLFGSLCIRKTAIVLLILSEVLIFFVIAINIAILVFFFQYNAQLPAGPYYFTYFYILNVVIVTYLIFKFILQLVFIIGLYQENKDIPEKPKSCFI